MAQSYSNDNIEACLVEPTCDKAKEAEGSASDTRSNQRAVLAKVFQGVIYIVSLTVAIWLIIQVIHLRLELDQLQKENVGLMSRRSRGSERHIEQPANQKENLTSENEGDKHRSRRHVNAGTSQGDGFNSYYDYGIGIGHPSFHVTGNQQPVLDNGNWFTFHTSQDPEYVMYSHENLKFVHSKFFEVTVPGYYFVYSQMHYASHSIVIGHEVVVLADCGDGVQFTILRATNSRSTELGGDTGYIGGVFYLTTNDRLGVRPLQSIHSAYEFNINISESSYFGAYLLSEDTNAEIDPDLRRCS